MTETTSVVLFRRYASRGGRYRYDLFRDADGFTYKEYDGSCLIGGGSYGTKSEVEVMEYVTRYLSFFPSKMREVDA